jgi:hypothetical protein
MNVDITPVPPTGVSCYYAKPVCEIRTAEQPGDLTELINRFLASSGNG